MERARVFPSLLLLLGIGAWCQAQTMPGYLLTLPQVLQAGSEENFCLTTHGLEEIAAFTLVLTHQDEEGVQYEYQHSFTPGENQCRNFTVPRETGFFEVTLENEAGVVSSNEDTLLVEVRGQNLMTFIQTDKPIYKAGQLVKFRILTLKRDLRPRSGVMESVYIKDPNDMRVKQWLNVDSPGLHDLEFQLVAEPKLGTWMIEVTIDEATTTQSFKVDEYVLPKFEVKITPPSFILVNADKIEGKVCAEYTYGKPVSGHLVMDVCLVGYGYGYGSLSRPCAHVVEEVEGCHQFSVSASEVGLDSSHHFYGARLRIDASVRERDTGSQVNETSDGPSLTHDPLTITLEDDTNGYFKPVFPYLGRAKVTRPDGSPAVGELIEVTVTDYQNDVRLTGKFNTNEQGRLDFAVCDGIIANTASFSLLAQAPAYSEDLNRLHLPRGFKTVKQWYSPSASYITIPKPRKPFRCGQDAEFDIHYTALPGSNTTFYYQVLSRGRIMQSGQHTQHFSAAPPAAPEDSSCLKKVVEPTPTPPVFLPEEPPMPPMEEGELEEVEEGMVEKGGEGPVEGMEEGTWEQPEGPRPVEEEIITPERFNPLEIRRRRQAEPESPEGGEGKTEERKEEGEGQEVSHFRLKLHLDAEMSPGASLLVYQVREDGETVADSVTFAIEPCFNNKVKMEFAEKSVLPGQESTLRLAAAPGSLCAVSVVDRSINILGGDHQLTPAKVFDKLMSYSVNPPGFQYSRDSEYCERKVKEQEEKASEGKTGEESMAIPSFHWFHYSSLYVDALQAFKQTRVAVLTNLALETRPCIKDYPVFYDYAMAEDMDAGESLGPDAMPLAMVTPDAEDEEEDAGHFVKGPSPGAPVRQHFPETWLWELDLVPEEGEALLLKKKAPHTITKWVGNSMCVSPRVGFGVSNLTSLTTFQPFFLSFTLPYAAVRGERLPIRISVFNYLDKCLNMQLRLEGTEAIEIHNQETFPFCVCGGQAHTKRFYVTPRDIGKLPLTARAEIIPGMCGNDVEMSTEYIGLTDAVKREILVKAEGVTQEYVRSSYMCPKGSKLTEMMDLPLPKEMVPDSARGEVSVVGDIMGPALSNLDHLVQQPTGCGEQTMVTFTPIVHVLQYLTSTGQLTKDMLTLATQYLEIGYQRELTFRHEDGSFSAFGKSDSSGSTWLTAYVVKSFAKARPFIYVDPSDLEQSYRFLRRVQLENGCFREVGRVFSSYMMGGLGKGTAPGDVTLTAFVLMSLLEANDSRNADAIEKGFQCLEQQEESSDPYTRALLAYTHTLRDPTSAASKRAIRALYRLAKRDGALRYWTRQSEVPEPVSTWFYHAAPSAEVEMTGYALLAVLQHFGEEAVARGQPIVLWLTKQRNAFGGFASTQDTVVGLQALSQFAAAVHTEEQGNVSVSVQGKDFSRTFHVQHGVNSLLSQSAPLSRLSNVLQVRVEGSGCAFVQASVRYNKLPEKPKAGQDLFRLTVQARRDGNDCARRTVHICVGYTDRGTFSSGMSLVNMKLVTGWSPVQQSLRELRSLFPLLNMKRFEHDEEKAEINFYFDEMDHRDRCFDVKLEQDQDLVVSDTKPAEVQVYQYYEKEVTVVETYELKTTCGTKEEIPDVLEPRVGASLSRDGAIPVQTRLGPGRPLGIEEDEFEPPVDCPLCAMEKPDNFDELVCNSTYVYKVIAGRKGKASMKVKANLRPRRKEKLDEFVKYDLDDTCPCFLVKPPKGKRGKRLLVLSKEEILTDGMLSLKSGATLLSLDHDRSLEKQARKTARSCSKKSRRRRP